VIIPFRDQWELLRNCLRSLRRSSYPGLEVVLVDNGSECPRLKRQLRRWEMEGRYRVVRDPSAFNFSRLCNLGARAASGEWLLFLNNDTEAMSPLWLEAMLAVAGREDVGVAGAALYYPDGTLQHIGMCRDTAGRWVHPHRGTPALDVRRHPELSRPRCVESVTGACLLMRRDRFWELGGFDESLPVTHNDVALCLRARARGWKVVVAPEARLLHYEGLSRGCEDAPASVDGAA
jgi:GT2 family glycosyltransferase